MPLNSHPIAKIQHFLIKTRILAHYGKFEKLKVEKLQIKCIFAIINYNALNFKINTKQNLANELALSN